MPRRNGTVPGDSLRLLTVRCRMRRAGKRCGQALEVRGLRAAPVDLRRAARGEGRYSPPECVGTQTEVLQGEPDPEHISTSHVERQNLTMRFTRLTNWFSKKLLKTMVRARISSRASSEGCRMTALAELGQRTPRSVPKDHMPAVDHALGAVQVAALVQCARPKRAWPSVLIDWTDPLWGFRIPLQMRFLLAPRPVSSRRGYG